MNTNDDAGAVLWAQAENLAATTGRDVLECLQHLQQTEEGRALTRQYNQEANLRSVRNANPGRRITATETDLPPARRYEQSTRPDEQIDRLAREHMAKTNSKDYSAAVSEVLRGRPDLAAGYKSFNCYRR